MNLVRSGASLADIARAAGVSTATVSNYLTGRHSPRPANRDRIERALVELDYRPNAAARALRSRLVGSVALLLEDPNHLGLDEPLHAAFASGAAQAAHDAGYGLTLGLMQPGEAEIEAARLVRERRADGAILSIGEVDNKRQRAIARFAAQGVPIVLLQHRPAIPGVSSVVAEDELGAAQAAEHLLSLGHEHIAFLSGEPVWPGPRRRLAGARAACDARGVELQEWYCSSYTVEAARERTGREFGRDRKVTAILAANDVIALGVIQQAARSGVSVPDGLSVVGFNDADFASWVRPTITSVSIPGRAIGARAVALLIDLTARQLPPESVAFQAELIRRESSGQLGRLSLDPPRTTETR